MEENFFVNIEKEAASLRFMRKHRKPMPKPSRPHKGNGYRRDKSWKKEINCF